MNKTTNFQIGEQLWVVTEPLQRTTAPPATSVDHVFVIDCSGSMSADLPKLRTRKYVGTPPMTADARAHWSEVCKQVRNPNLTRADVELAAHVTGLLVHPVRLARMEREDASA